MASIRKQIAIDVPPAAGRRLTHHNASARCRPEWIADLLPHAMAPAIADMIDAGLAAMKRTLESAATTAAK